MILILADDLTGANDTGVQFAKNGYRTIVQLRGARGAASPLLPGYDVTAINTDTRPLPPEEAYARVFALGRELKDQGAACVYKKVDSLMRGNPAPELEALMDAAGVPAAIVATAFPANARTVIGGKLITPDGQTVDVPDIFRRETKKRTVPVPLEEIRQGSAALGRRLAERRGAGAEIFVFDSETDADLRRIRDAAAALPGEKIYCGSAGLAGQLAHPRPKQGGTVPASGRICIVVGSRSAVTARQVRLAEQTFGTPVIQVHADRLAGCDRAEEIRSAAARVTAQYEAGGDLAILALDSLFADYAMERRSAAVYNRRAQILAEGLGEVVQQLCTQAGPLTFAAAGGDTALQLCAALGCGALELRDEILPGVPVGILRGGAGDGTVLVTKSGAFGAPDTFIQVVMYLRARSQTGTSGQTASKS